MTRLFIPFVAILLLGLSARAADQGIVEGVGEALVDSGGVVAAKQLATTRALQACIEKVVGITIESDFSAVQKEVVSGNRDQFYSNVKDTLVKKAKGFIKSYEILSEKREGNILKVSVRAHVFESKLKAELQSLADLIARAGNPKLMVVLQEVYVARDGSKKVSPHGLLAAHLEKELIKMGFELRGKLAARDTADESIDAYDRWLANAGGVAKMARDAGADILIAGRVEYIDHGPVTKEDVAGTGLDSLVGSTKMTALGEVKALEAANGDLLSSQPLRHMEYGSSFERAMHRGFKGRGANIVKKTFGKLLDDAKQSLKKMAKRGHAYEVRLRGVTKFRRQGRPFIELLSGLAGVSSVKQKSFDQGWLVVDVVCTCNANELQERIFGAAERAKSLVDLDLEGVSGRQLSFKL
jgi:hypothetical protein